MGTQRINDLTAGILARAGVGAADTVEQVRAAAETAIASRGYDAVIERFQWGELVVATDAHTARLLQMDSGPILEAINDAVPGACTTLTVRVRR